MVAALLLVCGALPFSTLKATEPDRAPIGQVAGNPAIFNPPVLFLSLTLFAFGGIFGVLEVTTFAFAKKLNLESWAFLPLSASAAGSFISGIGYGALRWRLALPRQLLVLTFILGATTLPFFFVNDIWLLTLMCLILGISCSPSMIVAMGLVEELVDKSRLTESMTWAVIGAGLGFGSGLFLSGPVIDFFGAERAFYSMVIFGCSTFFIVIAGQSSFKKTTVVNEI